MRRLHPALFALLVTAAFVTAGAQDAPRRSPFLPDAFEFGEGHAYMGRDWVKWEHNKLVVGKRVADMKGKGEFQETVEELSPSPEAWDRFWARAEALGVWEWKADYSSARSSMPDGESWSLTLKYGAKQVKSKGYNAVPDAYNAFREAVHHLVEDARRNPAGPRTSSELALVLESKLSGMASR